MAKADGKVTHDEIAAFRQRVHILPSESSRLAGFGIWPDKRRMAMRITPSRLLNSLSRRPPFLNNLLDLLFHIAASDGAITQPETEYLATVAQIFGFSDSDFARLQSPSWRVRPVRF